MKKPGTPRVSVIIPVYNTEAYLRQCLDSAVNQTLRDLEIICVNDGSTDGSAAVLEEYQAKDPRMIVVRQENLGLSAARNRGMKIARGKYIYFLDSDDEVDLQALEKCIGLAEEHELDAVVFGFGQFADSEGLMQIHPCRVELFSGPAQVCSGAEYMKTAKDCGSFSSPVWTAVWRRAFLKEKGLQFKEGILHEDMLFSFQAFMAADGVMAIPERLYHYRARPDSICTKPVSVDNVMGAFECAKGILKYALEAEQEPDREQEIRRAYRELCDYTCSLFSAVPAEEKEDAVPPGETDGELFRQMLARFREDGLMRELEERRREADRLERALAEKQKEAMHLQEEIGKTYASWTYRIGHAATWLPRKLRDGVRRRKEQGKRR